MIDYDLVTLALRARALALSSATTGSTSLSATATGYSRSSGSFLTDGFIVGMQLDASGFPTGANNGTHLIIAVSALTIDVKGVCVAEGPVTATLSVGLPAARGWENLTFDPDADHWYVKEELVPATSELLAGQPLGGFVEETGLYVLQIACVATYGAPAVNRVVRDLLRLYPPGDGQTLSDGTTLHIRGDAAPYRGQLMHDEPSWAIVVVTIPWRAQINTP